MLNLRGGTVPPANANTTWGLIDYLPFGNYLRGTTNPNPTLVHWHSGNGNGGQPRLNFGPVHVYLVILVTGISEQAIRRQCDRATGRQGDKATRQRGR